MSNAVLTCEGLTKYYEDAGGKVEVLKGVDLSIDTGEMIAIVGASGSGKSTLLHCIGALDTFNAGRVLWADESVVDMSEAKRSKLRNQNLGFVYQFHHLLGEFTALENVAMPGLIGGMSVAEAQTKAADILNQVGLASRLTHKPGELSGGERQRVALARALVCNPRCVLADEPTGNLDKQTAQHMLDLMLRLNQDLRTSFIVVTHDTMIASAMHRSLNLVDGSLYT